MSLLKRFFGRGCSHRFTWPRIDADGRHYQICPLLRNLLGESGGSLLPLRNLPCLLEIAGALSVITDVITEVMLDYVRDY